MVIAGAAFTAIVTGHVSTFSTRESLAGTVGRALVGAGIVVTDYSEVAPSVITDVVKFNALTPPYQDTLVCHTTFDYTSPEDIRGQIGMAYASLLNGAYPDSVALQFDDGSVWESPSLLSTPTDDLKRAGQATVQSARDVAASVAGLATRAVSGVQADVAGVLGGIKSTVTTTVLVVGVVVVVALAIVAWGPNTGSVVRAARVRTG